MHPNWTTFDTQQRATAVSRAASKWHFDHTENIVQFLCKTTGESSVCVVVLNVSGMDSNERIKVNLSTLLVLICVSDMCFG